MSSTITEIREYILANGGATVRLAGEGEMHLLGPRDGDVYCVGGALDHDGESVPETSIPVDDLTDAAVAGAITFVRLLTPASNWRACGFWIEDGMVVADSVDAIMGLQLALQVAEERGERAIYGLATGEIHMVGSAV